MTCALRSNWIYEGLIDAFVVIKGRPADFSDVLFDLGRCGARSLRS